MIKNFEDLLQKAIAIGTKRIVVVYPNNEETFSAIRKIVELRLAYPVLVGNPATIAEGLPDIAGDNDRLEIVQAMSVAEALKL